MHLSHGAQGGFDPNVEAKENENVRGSLRSKWRKSCRCSFTAAQNGGKAASAGFPPLGEEENWKLQLYRRLERRKSCKCSFTAASNGGKAASAGFPPLGEEENLQVQVYPSSSWGRAAVLVPLRSGAIFSFLILVMGQWSTKPFEFSFSTPCTHHLGATQQLAHPNGIHIQDAVESGRSRILLQLTGIISVRVNLGTVGEIIGRSV